MSSIKQVAICGYKKFMNFTVSLHDGLNIIIGENEAGKTTVVEAINITLNQWYRNSDKSIIEELMNSDFLDAYFAEPSVDTLPRMVIEVEFDMPDSLPIQSDYYGQEYELLTPGKPRFGISFHCEINEDYKSSLIDNINSGLIPYEYYDFSWRTFRGSSYILARSPLKYLAINTLDTSAISSFNYYNKKIFYNTYSDSDKLKYKNTFRDEMKKAFREVKLEDIDCDKKFAVDNKRVILDNVLTITEKGIALENKGKGRENLIKTQIALDKARIRTEVVTIEEPENHLSHTTLRKMIYDIQENHANKQLILTTHNSLIVSSLGLNNVIWLGEQEGHNLADAPKEVADYFAKLDNNNLMQFLLAERVVLVEGATEYLMVPEFYKILYPNSSMEKDQIDIISCNGLSYKKYLEIANKKGNKVVVITDNDSKTSNLADMKTYNDNHCKTKIFMANEINDMSWTWEANIYSSNKDIIESLIGTKDGAEYLYHGIDYGPFLGKMLNNKVETAYKLLPVIDKLVCPDYVKEALKWIRN